MTEPAPPPPEDRAAQSGPLRPMPVVPGRLERRMQRIREEIERNRADGPTIPTWVLFVALVVIVGGFITFIVLV